MYKRILVLTDGSDTSNLAVDAAIRLASVFNSRMRLVHVLDESLWLMGYDIHSRSSGALYQAVRQWGEEVLKKAVERARAAGVEADMLLVDKPGQGFGPSVAQAAASWEADLVVVGTHGRSGIGRLMLGSSAEQALRQSPVPVLVIRPPGDAARKAPGPQVESRDLALAA